MRRFTLTIAAAAFALTAGALVPMSASAMPLSTPTGLGLDGLNPIQDIAICFYLDGWNGPGLYECGYRRRQGLGWHGPRDGNHDQGRRNDRDRRGDYNRGDYNGRNSFGSGERRDR
jgi:hypothetical protein